MTVPPPARGARRDWSELPQHLVEALADALGSPIVAATTQTGGFSPGIAARVVCEDGRRAFVKAVAPVPNPRSPDFHRREARVVGGIPEAAPVPQLLWFHDEGPDGWVLLALEDVDGHEPAQPWRADELDRVLVGIDELVGALTPAPVAAPEVGPTLRDTINSWHLLRPDPPAELDQWSRRHLDTLTMLEEHVADALGGDTLLHFDLRADNILLTRDRVYFVDWPHAMVGASWLDCIAFAPSVAMQGGPQPEELLRRWPGAAEADTNAVAAAIASVAGFFTHRSLLPPEPGLPGLREFQAAQGAVARRWLAERLAY